MSPLCAACNDVRETSESFLWGFAASVRLRFLGHDAAVLELLVALADTLQAAQFAGRDDARSKLAWSTRVRLHSSFGTFFYCDHRS